jgi:hypothetical protein
MALVCAVTSGTTAQRPPNPVVGSIHFDTTLGAAVTWNGVTWAPTVAGTAPTIATVLVTGDDVTTSFPVIHNLALASPFQPSAVSVLDPAGSLLSASSYQLGSLAANQFTVTFAIVPTLGDVHRFRVTA